MRGLNPRVNCIAQVSCDLVLLNFLIRKMSIGSPSDANLTEIV